MNAVARLPLQLWFRRNTLKPVLIGHGIVLGFSLLFIATLISAQHQRRITAIQEFAAVAPRAIIQQNRPMLETLLIGLGYRVEARNLGICQTGRELIALYSQSRICSGAKESNSLLYVSSEFEVPGMPEYKVKFLAPRFQSGFELLFILLTGLMLVVLNTFIMNRVCRRLKEDLIQPLSGSNLDDVLISEVYELLKARENTSQLQIQLAVSESVRAMAEQVAHDIRSPLSALNILVAKAKGLAPDHLSMLANVSTRINTIASDLLAPHTETVTAINITRSVHRLTEEKRLYLAAEKIPIQLTLSSANENFSGYANSERFNRIVSNILNNAIEAMPSGGSISIQTSLEGGFAHILFSDNGPGIPAEVLLKLDGLEKITTKTDGHGIGLSSARKILESWGGDLKISSSAGEGARVSIRLRRA